MRWVIRICIGIADGMPSARVETRRYSLVTSVHETSPMVRSTAPGRWIQTSKADGYTCPHTCSAFRVCVHRAHHAAVDFVAQHLIFNFSEHADGQRRGPVSMRTGLEMRLNETFSIQPSDSI